MLMSGLQGIKVELLGPGLEPTFPDGASQSFLIFVYEATSLFMSSKDLAEEWENLGTVKHAT